MNRSSRARRLLSMFGASREGSRVEFLYRPTLARGASETALRGLVRSYVQKLCTHYKRNITRGDVIIPQRLVVADSVRLFANHDRGMVRDLLSENFMEIAGGLNTVETNFRANQASSPTRRVGKDVYILNLSTTVKSEEFRRRMFSRVLFDFFIGSQIQCMHAFVPQHTNVMVDIELVEYNPYILQFLLETGVGIITLIGDRPRDDSPLLSQRAQKALLDFLGDS